jgi:hypothetical protein
LNLQDFVFFARAWLLKSNYFIFFVMFIA